MARTTVFTRGSGVYTCQCCGRRTRDDGNGDSVHLQQCTQCYELNGLSNEIQDYGETPELLARCAQLREEIKQRGGNYRF